MGAACKRTDRRGVEVDQNTPDTPCVDNYVYVIENYFASDSPLPGDHSDGTSTQANSKERNRTRSILQTGNG